VEDGVRTIAHVEQLSLLVVASELRIW